MYWFLAWKLVYSCISTKTAIFIERKKCFKITARFWLYYVYIKLAYTIKMIVYLVYHDPIYILYLVEEIPRGRKL